MGTTLIEETGFHATHAAIQCDRCGVRPAVEFSASGADRTGLGPRQVRVCPPCIAEALAKLPAVRRLEFRTTLEAWIKEAYPDEPRTPLLTLVRDEVARATKKFPTWPTDPLHALAVLGEEFGELTKAVLQSVYEPHKSNPAEVRKEAEQTAAMALRFLASLDAYAYVPGVQHEQRSDE